MNKIINQFQNHLKNKILCPPTIRGYVFDAAQFIEWTEDNGIMLNLVTPENAGQYLNYLIASCHEIRPGVVGVYSSRTIMKKLRLCDHSLNSCEQIMNNPFASLDFRHLRINKKPNGKTLPNLDQQLTLVDVSKPSGVRDRVILLLRHKYKLRSSDISTLNISDMDLNSGIIHILRQPKKRTVVIDECDFLDLRRWNAVRK